MNVYKDGEAWKELMLRDMNCDYSWSASADMYIDTYNEILGK